MKRRCAVLLLAAGFVGAGCSPLAPRAYPEGPSEHLGAPAREPMLVEHPDGTLFVAGYGESVPTLWRSADRGATWMRVDVGTEPAGAIGNSDVDLAVAADGTLYFATMLYDRKAYEGLQINIGTSVDRGATWTWRNLSKTRLDDRPWVEVATDGTAHVIWNDGAGVRHALSRDRGQTWKEQPRIHDAGGSSHLAVGPGGELAVRITPLSASANRFHAGVDLVAVSLDGGASWQKHPAPVPTRWEPFNPDKPLMRWVEPLAWGADGALHAFTWNEAGFWLARSTDRGASWRNTKLAETGGLVAFPYLAARGAGELAATWFSLAGLVLEGHVARIVADGDGARIVATQTFRPDSWQREAAPGKPVEPDPAGEYLAVAFLRDGTIAVVSPIQNPATGRFGFAFRTVPRPRG